MKYTGQRSMAAARMGPVGRNARSPRKVTARRFLAQRAIAHHADERTVVKPLANIEHGSIWPRRRCRHPTGLIAARMALILRAFSSYMAMATRSPLWRLLKGA